MNQIEVRRLYRKQEILRYIEDGMSALPSKVLDSIPAKVQDQLFANRNRSHRSGTVCYTIYSLIDDGEITEIKGRYYKTGGAK